MRIFRSVLDDLALEDNFFGLAHRERGASMLVREVGLEERKVFACDTFFSVRGTSGKTAPRKLLNRVLKRSSLVIQLQ